MLLEQYLRLQREYKDHAKTSKVFYKECLCKSQQVQNLNVLEEGSVSVEDVMHRAPHAVGECSMLGPHCQVDGVRHV